MKKIGSFFIATIVALLVSSTILAGVVHISEAKKSSLEELRAQQQERQQQQQQQQKEQGLQTQAATSEKKPGTLQITSRFITSEPIPPGVSASALVLCEPGELATGGGFGSLPTRGEVRVTESQASSNNGWLVRAFNSDTVPQTMFISVKCLKLVP